LNPFGIPSPVGLIHSCATAFHVVPGRVAKVTGLTDPIVLPICTLALDAFFNIDFTIFAIPLHLNVKKILQGSKSKLIFN
jgi:hypothetical protein